MRRRMKINSWVKISLLLFQHYAYPHKMENKTITVYTVFQKIGNPLFSLYNFSKCWSILMKITSLCSSRIFSCCWIVFTYWSCKYSLQINGKHDVTATSVFPLREHVRSGNTDVAVKTTQQQEKFLSLDEQAFTLSIRAKWMVSITVPGGAAYKRSFARHWTVSLLPLLHVSAGWSSGSSGSRDCQSPESCDTRFHPTNLMATKQSRLESSGLQNLGQVTRTGVQDQNQGHPRATRTHCGRMG